MTTKTWFVASKQPQSVCDGFGALVASARTSEDAQLIASAPHLLNALQLIKRSMEKSGITFDNADLYNQISDTINKAEGK